VLTTISMTKNIEAAHGALHAFAPKTL